MDRKNKPKRNAPCPCGSGRKYKHCCLQPRRKREDRIAPSSFQALDSLIEQGYELAQKKMIFECCDTWLEAWEFLKPLVPAHIKSINKLANLHCTTTPLHTWCRDMDVVLATAALENTAYARKRINFCREVYTGFPKTDRPLIKQMKLGEGMSYYFIGRPDQGYAVYQNLCREFPEIAITEEIDRMSGDPACCPGCSEYLKNN